MKQRYGSLDLAPIGNCAVSALVDREGRYVWACVPRVDGDPTFCSLLSGRDPKEEQNGLWAIDLIDQVKSEQSYERNTPILVTRLTDARGGVLEIVDFCPRYRRYDRMFRPPAFVRIVRPIAGVPRVRMRLTPAVDWGAHGAERTSGTNHIRFLAAMTLRLTTTAPVSHIIRAREWRLENEQFFYLGPDEPFNDDIRDVLRGMYEKTRAYWWRWARTLATPLEWQGAVIRAAIALKLCVYEETGAIVAALTTSVPEAPNSGRNWDYRFCWLRDAYYTVQALNRLGAGDILEGYLTYLRNIIDAHPKGRIQPVFAVGLEPILNEVIIETLPGYRGMGPVRAGNQAHEHHQHDVYGQIVLSTVQAFFDERLIRAPGVDDFHTLETVGERAYQVYLKPDAGLWEFRTRAAVHTYSAVMCWAACDRLANAARKIGLPDREAFWRERAEEIRKTIQQRAWNDELGRFAGSLDGAEMDASLLQLVDTRFVAPDDKRFLATFKALEKDLRRGKHLLRYSERDDFGTPETAFNFCTFWYIEALALVGRKEEARELFEEMLARRTSAGLLSEDCDFNTGEAWGNYPQTYSLAGLINCAVLLSKPWSTVR
ncbi:MAG TPA: glycoside hydrolase family 15 protein [Vitreimonas sp.]|jgi:GH15 family glucan-1,4-alpha-glucosidase|nr:glycoside hydrolase family 15 protein [Vitreimonas sp.]